MLQNNLENMRFVVLFGLLSAVSFSDGFFSGPRWNSLKVKWNYNLLSPYTFAPMPRTTSAALIQGYTEISGCRDIPSINGRRFVKDGDYSIILLYDINGYIAGIQFGIPDTFGSFPPASVVDHPYLRVGDMYMLTAYFTDPAHICTKGRDLIQFILYGTGENLYIQNGTDPVTDSLKIPKEESEIQTTMWVRGRCFPTMGVHYWYDLRKDTVCDEGFPVFLLYNRGRLNAFGWTIARNVYGDIPTVERPSDLAARLTMVEVPDCFNETTQMTQHIFMTQPLLNIFC